MIFLTFGTSLHKQKHPNVHMYSENDIHFKKYFGNRPLYFDFLLNVLANCSRSQYCWVRVGRRSPKIDNLDSTKNKNSICT